MIPSLPPRRRWQRRSSPLARYALLAYVLIVVDASLFPFTGWRDLGLSPFEYLAADWPVHALPFDLFVNALGYAPLGFLVVLALHPRVRGMTAACFATLSCALLSVNLEALQTYLPTRVASKTDLLTNIAGGLVGALGAARVAHTLLDTGRLRGWRARWFANDASRGLVLVMVWFGALVYPDVFAFGTGGILRSVDPESADRIAAWFGLVESGDTDVAASRFQFAEATVTALAIVGVGLLFLGLMRPGVRWRLRASLVFVLFIATIVVQALAHALLFEGAEPWPPLTPGSRTGVGVAAGVLLIATGLPARSRWALGLAALTGALVLVNVYPENPYVNAVGLAWTRGRLMNFYGLASGLNLAWPWFAIAYLLRHRGAGGPRRPTGMPAGRGWPSL